MLHLALVLVRKQRCCRALCICVHMLVLKTFATVPVVLGMLPFKNLMENVAESLGTSVPVVSVDKCLGTGAVTVESVFDFVLDFVALFAGIPG